MMAVAAAVNCSIDSSREVVLKFSFAAERRVLSLGIAERELRHCPSLRNKV